MLFCKDADVSRETLLVWRAAFLGTWGLNLGCRPSTACVPRLRFTKHCVRVTYTAGSDVLAFLETGNLGRVHSAMFPLRPRVGPLPASSGSQHGLGVPRWSPQSCSPPFLQGDQSRWNEDWPSCRRTSPYLISSTACKMSFQRRSCSRVPGLRTPAWFF